MASRVIPIHKLTREIRFKVYREFSIILTIGIYAKNAKFSEIYNNILDITKKYEEVLQVHGFYVDEEKQLVSFDMIVDFDANRDDVKEKILNEIKIKYPQFNYFILDDYDVSD